jgi:hypothetical protein
MYTKIREKVSVQGLNSSEKIKGHKVNPIHGSIPAPTPEDVSAPCCP